MELVCSISCWADGCEPESFNTLYCINRSRFFLANVTDKTDPNEPTKLPRSAFREIDLCGALEWAVCIENKWDSFTGTLTPLIEGALKLLSKQNRLN